MTGALGKSILTLNASMRSNSAALLRATAEPANLVGTEVSGYSDRGLTGRGLLPQRPQTVELRECINAVQHSVTRPNRAAPQRLREVPMCNRAASPACADGKNSGLRAS